MLGPGVKALGSILASPSCTAYQLATCPTYFFIKLQAALNFKTPGNKKLSHQFPRCIPTG